MHAPFARRGISGSTIYEVLIGYRDFALKSHGILTLTIHVRRTEVAKHCRSCANRIEGKRTLRTDSCREMRPKFRHNNGLLGTAYKSSEQSVPTFQNIVD